MKLYYNKNSKDPIYYAQQGFRNGKKVTTKNVRRFGRHSELLATHEDPLAWVKSEIAKMNEEYRVGKCDVSLSIDFNQKVDPSDSQSSKSTTLNTGYLYLKYIYDQLDLKSFFKKKCAGRKMKFNPDDINSFLTYARILDPDSKLGTFDRLDSYYGAPSFSYNDIHRFMEFMSPFYNDYISWLYDHSDKVVKRDSSVIYYDCTNFYFEIEYNDGDVVDDKGNIIRSGLRKRGPEKNKRPDPIVEMGLLMDSNGIPLAYNVFPGNESEKLSLMPVTARVRRDYGIERTIVVADRGLNTSDNIFFLAGKNEDRDNPRDGYVYGQSVRGASDEFKKWVLDEEGYTVDIVEENGKKIAFTHKSRVIARELKIKRDGKRKSKVNVCQKQMVYFSFKYMMKQRYERMKMIEKAENIVKNPQAYTRATSYGAAYYIDNIAFDRETGEVKTDTQLTVNYEKMAEEEKYDGYYAIVTSEIEYEDHKIREIYRGLAKIEESFKVTKSYLKSRPVFVWTPGHIKGHFLICFIALVITRLLEKRLGNKYSIPQIIESLKKYSCINIDTNTYQFLYRDEIIDSLAKEFGIELNRKYRTRDQIKKLLRYK